VTHYFTGQICALIDRYKAKKEKIRQFCRVFYTKKLVNREDAVSYMSTKITPEEVFALPLDARRVVKAS
jgi:hypothetical protein